MESLREFLCDFIRRIFQKIGGITVLLFYVRHGDPIYKPDQLTPLGKRQAEAVARRLALYGIDEIYSSTSVRAMETAAPTSEITKNEIHTLDWAHEKHAYRDFSLPYGDEGKKTWIFSHPDYNNFLVGREMRELGYKWYEHPRIAQFHFENGLERVRRETRNWLMSLGYEYDEDTGLYKIIAEDPDKRVAFFAHEGFGKLFLSILLDMTYPMFASHFELKHSGVTVISFEDTGRFDTKGYARARLLTLSNDSHLYRDGLPTTHISTGLVTKY